tara:strand:- start:657 stop:902 length:246 start_codon:yes stop_codon:yes gene_type:complete
MIEIYMTNIKSETLSKEILRYLESHYPNLKINFDLEDFDKPYPCGHSILRIEGESINTNSISSRLRSKGIKCELLEDKPCV